MRLIDAETLKEMVYAEFGNSNLSDAFNDLIDNAPTVEIPTELCKGCRFLKDCETCEEKLRPQGEWITIDAFVVKCSVCGVESFATPFCPRCGARMRKGGAE